MIEDCAKVWEDCYVAALRWCDERRIDRVRAIDVACAIFAKIPGTAIGRLAELSGGVLGGVGDTNHNPQGEDSKTDLPVRW